MARSNATKKSDKTTSTCWKPDSELTIYSVVDNKAKLMALLDSTEQLEIDLSEIIELDTAGLQLLILAKRESTEKGKKLTMSGHSETVLDVFELCNLSGFFGDPVLIPAECPPQGADK